jgi:hypothetical protein
MPPRPGEHGIAACQRLADRYGIQHDQAGDACVVVDGEPVGNVAATIVPDDGTALVAQSSLIARFEYGAWSEVVAGFDERP